MKFSEIKELIEIFSEKNLTNLTIKDDDFEISLDKNLTIEPTTTVTPTIIPQQTPVQTLTEAPKECGTATVDSSEGEIIHSPMVGTFYKAPSPESPDYAKVGDKVRAGDTICILEAMKIMNELDAEFDCEILEILVEDGQAVEYDTPLFRVKR